MKDSKPINTIQIYINIKLNNMTNEQLNNIFDEFKTRLMKEIKPEIVNGVWYKCTEGTNRVNFTDIDKKEGYGYGWRGHFTHSKWIGENLTPMTHDEIKDMLVKHAVSLGIKEGVTVDRGMLGIEWLDNNIICGSDFDYDYKKDMLSLGMTLIYEKGIWATVVKEKTSEDWLSKYRHQFKCLDDFMQTNNLEFIQRK